MEAVKAAERFLSDSGDGSGYGNGYGNSFGNGYGNGYGYGYGSGYGYGYGNSFGSGYGSGSGSGYGSGGISRFCGEPVYDTDGVPTIIRRARGNLASGEILLGDMTKEKTYVAKGDGLFAHGKTVREAAENLRDKIAARMSEEERIAEFVRKYPDIESRATHKELFARHGRLTGSCEQGRRLFCRERGIDPDSDEKMSVRDFTALTRNEYGGDAIRALEKTYGKALPSKESDK
jgi:hypothetical protein